jgi:hypothetical protein
MIDARCINYWQINVQIKFSRLIPTHIFEGELPTPYVPWVELNGVKKVDADMVCKHADLAKSIKELVGKMEAWADDMIDRNLKTILQLIL